MSKIPGFCACSVSLICKCLLFSGCKKLRQQLETPTFQVTKADYMPRVAVSKITKIKLGVTASSVSLTL